MLHAVDEAAAASGYLTACVADELRERLLAGRESFAFETVLSDPSKVDFMRRARAAGYRVYLYFVATDDAEINVARVRARVLSGGHDVPEDKVRARYGRCLEILSRAVEACNRAYLFDNSGDEPELCLTYDAAAATRRWTPDQSSSLPPWIQKLMPEQK